MQLHGGEKVLLFLAGANHDPGRWNDPDRVEIRPKLGHVGFGSGDSRMRGTSSCSARSQDRADRWREGSSQLSSSVDRNCC